MDQQNYYTPIQQAMGAPAINAEDDPDTEPAATSRPSVPGSGRATATTSAGSSVSSGSAATGVPSTA
jgi:hypothetical protein